MRAIVQTRKLANFLGSLNLMNNPTNGSSMNATITETIRVIQKARPK